MNRCLTERHMGCVKENGISEQSVESEKQRPTERAASQNDWSI